MKKRIPITILTGFLGSGKTTIIQNILRQSQDKRIALLVNEFGDVGVDGDLLRHCDDEDCLPDGVIELANGCICCTVADDFLPAMQTLLTLDPLPDHIIIETSGLALPQPLVKAFGWPDIKTKIMLDAILTLIDTPAFLAGRFADDEQALQAQRLADDSLDHDNPIHEVFSDQLMAANILLLGKADRLSASQLDEAKEKLMAITHRPPQFLEIHHGKAPLQALLGLDLEDEAILRSDDPHHHQGEDDHDHDEFSSAIIDMPLIEDVNEFSEMIKQTMRDHKLLRAKGRLAIKGKMAPYIVQMVGDDMEAYFAPPSLISDKTKDSALVVIALGARDHQAIAKQLGGKLR